MNFGFATPWALLLLMTIPVLAVLPRWQNRINAPASFRFPSAVLIASTNVSWRTRFIPTLRFLRLFAIALVIVAIARPQTSDSTEVIKGEGVDIALALDVSGSMSSLDFQPNNRLDAAKQVISEFVTERRYDRIGLVVMAKEAFVSSPPTIDHLSLQTMLGKVKLAQELQLEDGTAIGSGLASAANILKNSQTVSKVIVLLTDGVNNSGQIDPITAALAVKALGIKVHAIGVGKPGLVPFPTRTIFGDDIVYRESDLDEETLKQIAETTGGLYFRATSTEALSEIYNEINLLEKSRIEVQIFNKYHELALWLLIPGILTIVLEVLLKNTLLRRVP